MVTWVARVNRQTIIVWALTQIYYSESISMGHDEDLYWDTRDFSPPSSHRVTAGSMLMN